MFSCVCCECVDNKIYLLLLAVFVQLNNSCRKSIKFKLHYCHASSELWNHTILQIIIRIRNNNSFWRTEKINITATFWGETSKIDFITITKVFRHFFSNLWSFFIPIQLKILIMQTVDKSEKARRCFFMLLWIGIHFYSINFLVDTFP